MPTAAPAISCTAAVEQLGARTLLRLPAEASAALPSRGQVAAEASIAGRTVMVVVEPDGRRGHWLDLGAYVPDGGWRPGASVSVTLTPTKAWPEPSVPDDLADALAQASDLHETWASLTPMARWEWVRWVRATRSATTRARRVEVSIDKMRNGKRRPCCFDLSSCTDPELARSGKLPLVQN